MAGSTLYAEPFGGADLYKVGGDLTDLSDLEQDVESL